MKWINTKELVSLLKRFPNEEVEVVDYQDGSLASALFGMKADGEKYFRLTGTGRQILTPKPRCFALTATDIGKSCPRFSCEVSTRGKSPSEWWRNLVCWGVWTTSLPNTGSTMCECASIAIA